MASWISFPKTQRRGLEWQFKSVSHLHLVAMEAKDVGQNFLVGEFRVTGREKVCMLSPRYLWIIRRNNIRGEIYKVWEAPAWEVKRVLGAFFVTKAQGEACFKRKEELSDASDGSSVG